MRIREHPGISSWPPSWLSLSGSQEKQSPGESGTLTNVNLSRIDPITICYLTTQLADEHFMGTLMCKEPEVCRFVYNLLKESIGKSIAEIGDLELPNI